MVGWTITKTDPSNKEVIGVSGGSLTRDYILNSRDKIEFICLSIGEEGYIKGYYLNADHPGLVDFEPLDDYGMPNFGFTSMFYRGVFSNQWQEL